jgi:hypothetical protein
MQSANDSSAEGKGFSGIWSALICPRIAPVWKRPSLRVIVVEQKFRRNSLVAGQGGEGPGLARGLPPAAASLRALWCEPGGLGLPGGARYASHTPFFLFPEIPLVRGPARPLFFSFGCRPTAPARARRVCPARGQAGVGHRTGSWYLRVCASNATTPPVWVRPLACRSDRNDWNSTREREDPTGMAPS